MAEPMRQGPVSKDKGQCRNSPKLSRESPHQNVPRVRIGEGLLVSFENLIPNSKRAAVNVTPTISSFKAADESRVSASRQGTRFTVSASHVDSSSVATAAGRQRGSGGEEEAGVHEGGSAEARHQRPYAHREGRELEDGASKGTGGIASPRADEDRRVLDRRRDRHHRLHCEK